MSSARLDFERLNNKNPAKAQAMFERLTDARLQWRRGHYGLGQAHEETGNGDPAIASFSAASTLQDVVDLPDDDRLGVAPQVKGLRESVRAAFVCWLAAAKGKPRHLKDTPKRLNELR